MGGHQHNQQNGDNLDSFAAGREPQSFSRARRHSRRVRFLKIFLPLAAAGFAAVFYWFTFFAAPAGKAVVAADSAESQGNKLVMIAPKVEGYTKNNRPYAIKAEKAVQDPEKSGIIALENIAGSVPLGNRGNARIEAARAVFDNVSGLLHFNEPFTVTTADGISARLLSADIGVQSGQMDSFSKQKCAADSLSQAPLSQAEPQQAEVPCPGQVEIKSATQNLTAASMSVRDNGRIIRFGGRVHIVINKDGEPADKSAPLPPQ